jgi:hypothetical protein
MLRLDRPVGAKELSDILGLGEHTVARYLRILGYLNLVVRTAYRGGYIVLAGHQLFLVQGLNVENRHFTPTTNINHNIKENKKNEDIVVIDQPPKTENLPYPVNPPQANPAYRTLLAANIGEPKRSTLSLLPHITPEYVIAWETYLKSTKGDRYTPGLLIHVLETGDPAPPINEHGHAIECRCDICQPYIPLICPDCHCRPCDCE